MIVFQYFCFYIGVSHFQETDIQWELNDEACFGVRGLTSWPPNRRFPKFDRTYMCSYLRSFILSFFVCARQVANFPNSNPRLLGGESARSDKGCRFRDLGYRV